MNQPEGAEREAIEHDRDLAWELYDAQPQHPRIPQLAQSVLARAPQFTGMIILTALHREACGEPDEARRLLQELMGRRDRQYVNAVRKLRNLEFSQANYAESLRLAEIVLREDPEATWMDRMELASALAYVDDPETAWRLLDEAVEFSARTDPDGYPDALGQRAARFLTTAAPPDRFLTAAEQAVEADPTESLLATALAFAYLFDYRPYEAREIFARVLREDPTDEAAQGGMFIAKGFIDPLEGTEYTVDDLRRLGMGEVAWRILRDTLFGTGMDEALLALDAVLPDDLSESLLPALDREEARASGGDDKLLAWHDGQQPGTGHLWGTGESFRLMTGAEVHAMDEAIEADPAGWPQWDAQNDYYTQLFTDEAGAYLIEGTAGRLYRRTPGQDDVEIAPSLADWLWDRVVAFGGRDPRPGRAARAS